MPYDFTYTLNLMNKTNNQSTIGFTDTENRLTVVREERCWGLCKKCEGIKQRESIIDTDNGMVTIRGDGVWEEVEDSKRGINGDGRKLVVVNIQVICTLESDILLLTNVIPINLILFKKKKKYVIKV